MKNKNAIITKLITVIFSDDQYQDKMNTRNRNCIQTLKDETSNKKKSTIYCKTKDVAFDRIYSDHYDMHFYRVLPGVEKSSALIIFIYASFIAPVYKSITHAV